MASEEGASRKHGSWEGWQYHHCPHHPHDHDHHHHAQHDDRRISHARLVLAQVMGRVALRASAAEGSWFFQSRSHISFSKIDSLSLSFSSLRFVIFFEESFCWFPTAMWNLHWFWKLFLIYFVLRSRQEIHRKYRSHRFQIFIVAAHDDGRLLRSGASLIKKYVCYTTL